MRLHITSLGDRPAAMVTMSEFGLRSVPQLWSFCVEHNTDPYRSFAWPFSKHARNKLLSWMWKIGVCERWAATTVFLAVLYLDLYLTHKSITILQLQDYAVVCMMLACKINEVNTNFDLRRCRLYGGDTLETAQYRSIELDILFGLDFRLNLVTYYHWVEENRWDPPGTLGLPLLLALGWDRGVRLPSRQSSRKRPTGAAPRAPAPTSPRPLKRMRARLARQPPPTPETLREAAEIVTENANIQDTTVKQSLNAMAMYLGLPVFQKDVRKRARQVLLDSVAQKIK